MAGSIHNNYEDEILDHIAGTASLTHPSQLYVGAFPTGTPLTESSAGTEVTGGTYARQSVNFSAASGGTTSNSNVVEFPAGVNGSGATITQIGLFDASSGGNLIWWMDLASSKVVGATDILRFPIGDIDLSLD